MQRILTLTALVLSLASTAFAQSGVTFTASVDHSTSNVSGYTFEAYPPGATTAARTLNLGKPAPGAGNDITVRDPNLFGNLPAGTYTVYVSAVGPGGVGRSSGVNTSIAPPLTAPAPPTNVRIITDTVAVGTALPTRLEFENFDLGGERVSYHDTTAENFGEEYRLADAVDVERTSDAGLGYNVGWVVGGEWLQYTVSVATARAYPVTVRASCPGCSSTQGLFYIDVDGVRVGSFRVGNTGSWQTYQTFTPTFAGSTVPGSLTLSAGTHVIRFTASNASLLGNLNWVEFR